MTQCSERGTSHREQMPTVIVERPAAQTTAGQVSDAALIEESLADPSCFAAIFDRHADAILRYACARVGSQVAEDVTAETFLAAFGRRGHYDISRADARPWLYGIAVRQIGKHRRAEAMQHRLLAAVPADLFTADFGDRSAERMTAEHLRPRLVAVISGLPRRDRGAAVADRLGRAVLRPGGRGARHFRRCRALPAEPDPGAGQESTGRDKSRQCR